MRTIRRLALALTLATVGVTPAWACPNCKETAELAIESAAEVGFDDPLAEARAYNRSIYVMLAVPYTIVTFGGFYCYRHLRGQNLPAG